MDLDQLEKKLGIDGMSADEQMEVVSALQKSAQEKLDFVRKETIGKSAEVVIQGFKKIKSDLETRFQELDASIQAKASTLKNGVDGKDGKDGKDGRNGKDGAKGEKGDKGDKGDNGLDGQDGVSVTDAKIDFDGSLVITLSTGREISVGEVVSPEIAEKIKVISTMSTNGAVAVKDEGTSITSGVKTLNFVGATVTATNSGDDVTVNVSAGTGTVTSVALSGGTTGLTASGSPITTTGTITLAGTLALANGGTGSTTASDARTALGLVIGTDVLAPTGSAANLTSFPTFNQNTTGSAATLTTGRTIAITGDLSYTSPSFNGSSNVTAVGTLATVNTNVGSFTNASVTVNGKGLVTAVSSGTAPVTSVTGTSPIASSGGATPAISLATAYGDTQNPYASKTANYFLAAPNGTAGAPTFRAVVAADIPTLNQNTTGTAANITASSNSTLTTLSALSLPGSQVSGNISGNASNVTGTVAIANGGTGQTTQTAAYDALNPNTTLGDIAYRGASNNVRLAGNTTATKKFLAQTGTGTVSAAPAWATIVAGDVPTLNQDTTGSAGSLVTTNFSIVQSGTKLLFKYGATTIASMDSTGIITSATNIVANGTP